MTVRAVPANLLGHAGKHYVIFELYLGGYLAALAPMGTTTSDVLVLDADGRSPGCAIQVKTRRGRGRRREWIMHQKHETLVADRYLYAFVDTGSSPPDVYIVPSDVVADAVARNHEAWLSGEPRRGPTRKDSSMRKIATEFPHAVAGYPAGWLQHWKDRWDLIEAAVAIETD